MKKGWSWSAKEGESVLELYEGKHYPIGVTESDWIERLKSALETRRVAPPMFCGISVIEENTTTKLINELKIHEDDLPKRSGKTDPLSYTITVLKHSTLRERFYKEFDTEAIIKQHVTNNKGVMLRFSIRGRHMDVPAGKFFNESNMTYGSWSFVSLIRRYWNEVEGWHKYFKQPKEKSVDSGINVLKQEVMAPYTEYFIKKMGEDKSSKSKKEKMFQDTAKKFVEMFKLFQDALFTHGEDDKKGKKKRQDRGVDTPAFMEFKNIDRNLGADIAAKTKDVHGFQLNRVFEEVVRLGKVRDKTYNYYSFIKPLYSELEFRQIEGLKKDRANEAESKATMVILNPTLVKETDFRKMVDNMVSAVFGGVHAKRKVKWNQIKLNTEEKVFAAACLLQLGIGSRAKGVLGINQIEEYDGRSKKKEEMDSEDFERDNILENRELVLKGQPFYHALRVRRVTKEKEMDAQVVTQQSKNVKLGLKTTEAEVREMLKRESSQRVIDKPFQYYFFDPLTYYSDIKDRNEVYGGKDESKWGSRDVFLQLLQQVREYLSKTDHGKKIKWVTYKTGDRKIKIVDTQQDDIRSVLQFFSWAHEKMDRVCKGFLDTLPTLKSKSTHQLRRLYVCYSFRYFGEGKMKELGYAQYVLRHRSIKSSVRYTTLQFEMDMDLKLEAVKQFQKHFADEVLKTRREIEELKEMMSGTTTDMRVEDTPRGYVKLKTDDGETVLFEKRKRKSRGVEMNEEYKRGVVEDVVKRMKKEGVRITRTSITAAGVNSTIAKDVMDMAREDGII
jgi:hypothetical protein